MNTKNRAIRRWWFFNKEPESDVPEPESYGDQDDKSMPREIYYFPDRIPISDLDSIQTTDPLSLLGIPLRLEFIETNELRLRDIPEDFTCRIYRLEQFEIGISDGFQGILPKYNLNNLEQILEIEKKLAFPLRIKEKIAHHKAEKEAFENRIELNMKRLQGLEETKKKEETTLQALEEKRRSINNANLEKEIGLRQKELLRLEQENEISTHSEGSNLKFEATDQERRSSIVTLITGLLLTVAACIFVIADVSLSIAAIYALGFTDIDGIGWRDVIFDISKWPTHWEGISVCFGIAFITFFFKYIYELLQDSRKQFTKRKLYFLIPVGILCALTVIELGILRAEYISSELITDLNEETYLGINPLWVKAGMILTTILFPFVGAVLLSEGMARIFGTLDKIIKSFFKKSSNMRLRIKWTNIDFMPGTLANRIKNKEQSISVLTTKIEELQNSNIELKARIQQIDTHLPIWHEALGQYGGRWENISKLERSMYLHGYEQGRKLRLKVGPYKLIIQNMAAQLQDSTNHSEKRTKKANRIKPRRSKQK